MALADTLDTAERAQQFRVRSRAVTPDDAALWHHEPGTPIVRLSQREAMEHVRGRLVSQPARSGDRAYFQGPAMTLAARLAGYGYVGDGQTTTVMGHPESTLADVAALRPARILASATWIDELGAHLHATPAGRGESLAEALGSAGYEHGCGGSASAEPPPHGSANACALSNPSARSRRATARAARGSGRAPERGLAGLRRAVLRRPSREVVRAPGRRSAPASGHLDQTRTVGSNSFRCSSTAKRSVMPAM